MSYSDIGEAVGLSRVAVKARISALEDRGNYFRRITYTTIINPQKISGAISVIFELEMEPPLICRGGGYSEPNDSITRLCGCRAGVSSMFTPWAARKREMEDFKPRDPHFPPGCRPGDEL